MLGSLETHIGIQGLNNFFRQILFEILGPNSVSLTKYDAFCSHILIYACLRRKDSRYRMGWKL